MAMRNFYLRIVSYVQNKMTKKPFPNKTAKLTASWFWKSSQNGFGQS